MEHFSKFIEVEPHQTVSSETRRAIRSHAARASNLKYGLPLRKRSGVPKRKGEKGVSISTEDLSDLKTVHQDETDHEPSEEVPPNECVQHEQRLVPFAGNDIAIPAAGHRLHGLPCLPLIITNYLDNLAVAIPELDGPDETLLLRKSWFPMVLHSQTLFPIIALFSASHYASYKNDASIVPDILFIKHYALLHLQQALTSGGTLCRDENIAAVAKMASYEAVYGTEDDYHTHMDAVDRMLEQRGGLSSLGLNGFLARLLVFIDTNSAFLLNTRLHLIGSSFPRREPFIPPRPDRFIGVPPEPDD